MAARARIDIDDPRLEASSVEEVIWESIGRGDTEIELHPCWWRWAARDFLESRLGVLQPDGSVRVGGPVILRMFVPERKG